MDTPRNRSYPLRISPSMRRELEVLAREEGLSLNHLISIALAEKLSRLEHDAWLAQQAAGKPLPAIAAPLARMSRPTRFLAS